MNPGSRTVDQLTALERLNFLLTNRIPRRFLTLAVGRLSKIESPLLAAISIYIWRLFVDDLRLFEAEQSRFNSLHACFTRKLKADARPIDGRANVVVSPCDAVVGEFGDVNDYKVFQAKGFPYSICQLLNNRTLAQRYRYGRFVTLRLKSSMYHRLHAPCDGRIETVNYISGDTWNVNPVALRVVQNLFCENERAVMEVLVDEGSITLVPVAAILVASMRFHGLKVPLNLQYAGPNRLLLQRSYQKGEEMGYFEHGSTVLLFATREYQFFDHIQSGAIIRMGQPLMTNRTLN